MQACLYSPRGELLLFQGQRISTHFGTSPTSHPVFGALIARQLEQMWHLLSDPPVFHVLEVGSGDGALARSVPCRPVGGWPLGWLRCSTTSLQAPEPRWLPSPDHPLAWDHGTGRMMVSRIRRNALLGVQRVKTEGLRAFRKVVGCIPV